jgi:hypothetical protein
MGFFQQDTSNAERATIKFKISDTEPKACMFSEVQEECLWCARSFL